MQFGTIQAGNSSQSLSTYQTSTYPGSITVNAMPFDTWAGFIKEVENYGQFSTPLSKTNYYYSFSDNPQTTYSNKFLSNNAFRLTREVNTQYSNGQSLVQTKKYGYLYSDTNYVNVLDYVKNITQANSEGRTIGKAFSYRFEYIYFAPGYPNNYYWYWPFSNKVSETDYYNVGSNSYTTLIKWFYSYWQGPLQILPSKCCNNILYHRIDQSKLDTPILSTLMPTSWQSKEYIVRDDKNNVLETKYPDDVYGACIWDTRFGVKLADVANARYNEIAQTSFEGTFTSSTDYSKGNWEFNPVGVVIGTNAVYTKPITGRYYYELSQLNNVVSKNALSANKIYILTLWSTGQPTISFGSTNLTLTQHYQVNDWKLYSVQITGNGSNKITISSSSTVKLDELRLYPLGSSMTTYTYEPLLGVSSTCDFRNNIVYQEYDVMGNPSLVRDINGSIISKTETVIQGSDNN